MKEEIIKKAIEIANILFQSDELHISNNELKNYLKGDLSEHYDVIKSGLCSIQKIEKKQGRQGGVRYSPGRNRRPELSPSDIKNLEKSIVESLKTNNLKTERKSPEFEVEIAFKNWLERSTQEESPNTIINFRSSKRKAGKWKNVDGYKISAYQFKYHFLFKPVLTTFEIKATTPNIRDILQAKNYLSFSHHVFLVFKDERSHIEISDELKRNGFSTHEGIGIYRTKDLTTFDKLFDSKLNTPQEVEIENAIDMLLSDKDKDSLEQLKYKYLQEAFINSIS